MRNNKSFKKLRQPWTKLLLIAVLGIGATLAVQAVKRLNADGPINVWWPKNGVRVNNLQAFKAQLQDKDVSEYSMTWAVDGGQPNSMYDSSTDYPHKEAMVDLQGWTWKGAGPYKITFKATGKDGSNLGETSVEIFTAEPAQGPVQVEIPTASASPSASPSPVSSNVEITDVVPSASPSASPSATPTPVPSAAPSLIGSIGSALGLKSAAAKPLSGNLKIAYPTQNVDARGVTTFKARLEGATLDSYGMYWQVDSGTLNPMFNIGDYKEAHVDTSTWLWRGDGPYVVTIIAKAQDGTTITQENVVIRATKGDASSIKKTETAPTPSVSPSASPIPSPYVSPSPTVSPSASPVPQVSSASGNPFAGTVFAKAPNSDAQRQADAWRNSRPSDAALMDKIAAHVDQVVWLGGWNSDVAGDTRKAVADFKSRGAMPVFVTYNIPQRDCGQYSAGGVGSAGEYAGWIGKIADAIGSNKAVVIIEPDALTLTDCLGSNVGTRYQMIKDAVNTFKSKGNIAVYIDAGHPGWIAPDEMARRLTSSGVANANGFSLNVSNFYTTGDNISYGQQVSSKIGGKHFVIDTGRNGNGPTPDKQWCNPWGRALGNRPTANTGNNLVDAFLWIKGPGASDGSCNGAPSAGVWWPDYAIDIAKNTNW